MSKKVILNSQCLPKKNYHCGNAVSHIVSEISYLFFTEFDKKNDFYFVNDSWNLHGLPFETMYVEKFGSNINYEKIKDFAEECINYAKHEKSFFSNIKLGPNIIEHSDTDPEFVRYTTDIFHELIDSKIIIKTGNHYSLDLLSIKNTLNFDGIKIFPSQHRTTIVNDAKMINGLYPITKNRVFSPSINIDNINYVINPIFQSFVYPLYISEKYGFNYPVFLFTSSSGHGMLKWHYLRNIVSFALSQNHPYENLVLHGNILGANNRRMSKHDNNVVKPSDLYKILPDRRFVRHVLIKSISDKDLMLQTDISFSEFNKIKNKLDIIHTNEFNILNPKNLNITLTSIKNDLKNFKIKKAFDCFVDFIRRAQIVQTDSVVDGEFLELIKICNVFYGNKK
ncbi:MAG: class I tRNA ligase family protein [Candidatus Paceibacterota bacterium]|jgi:hypothetical protein